MSKLDKHISELLYDHECVIVPELGGFLSSYLPSRVHQSRHMVTPPSKKIAFNVFLRQNDGLLANYLVQAENISYPDALREIDGYVEHCNRELGSGKKFVIERVGILTRDSETNIQFEPFNNVNYLKDSFGLSPVQFIPVQHSDFEQEVEKQLRDFISLRPSRAQARQAVMPRKARLNALNTMLLSGSILWFCLNLYIVSPGKVNLASLNPFSISTSSAPTVSAPDAKSEIYTQPAESKPETAEAVSIEPEKSIAGPAKKLEDVLGKKTNAQNFFIIAGAFSSADNAAKKEAELKAQGFSNAHVIKNNEGLSLVCYEGFSTREGALDELNRLKALKKEGWIFPK